MFQSIVGSWRLVSFELKSDQDESLYPFGEQPDGMITYTADGFMSTTLHSSGRSHFATDDILSGTAEEFSDAMKTYSHYAGRFNIEGDQVVHIIEHSLFPNWVGHREQRTYLISNDQLTLETEPFTIAGDLRRGIVQFRRL